MQQPLGHIDSRGGVKYDTPSPYSTPPIQDEPPSPSPGAFNPQQMEAVYGRRGWEVVGYNVATPQGVERVWLSDQERIVVNNAQDQSQVMPVMMGAWNRAHRLPTQTSPDYASAGMPPPHPTTAPVGPVGPDLMADAAGPGQMAAHPEMMPPPMPMEPEEPPDNTRQLAALDDVRQRFPGVSVDPVSHDKLRISFPENTQKEDAKRIMGEIDQVIDAHKNNNGGTLDLSGGPQHPPGCPCPMCKANGADMNLQGAVADYKQRQQNMAAANGGMDKSMEYRGMQKPASAPMRMGRGGAYMKV